ncbi:hypothetical protein EI94DRAFT_1698051 [Lactarius quietus]|nr:hypothetical protein EI94DRAFT_1698051 [Lactarius quietus]
MATRCMVHPEHGGGGTSLSHPLGLHTIGTGHARKWAEGGHPAHHPGPCASEVEGAQPRWSMPQHPSLRAKGRGDGRAVAHGGRRGEGGGTGGKGEQGAPGGVAQPEKRVWGAPIGWWMQQGGGKRVSSPRPLHVHPTGNAAERGGRGMQGGDGGGRAQGGDRGEGCREEMEGVGAQEETGGGAGRRGGVQEEMKGGAQGGDWGEGERREETGGGTQGEDGGRDTGRRQRGWGAGRNGGGGGSGGDGGHREETIPCHLIFLLSTLVLALALLYFYKP